MYECVIYKILSPSGRVYIGQTVNYQIRYNKYKNLNCKRQTRLYNSFLKYGFENHMFNIIEECSIEDLNIRERYYQDLYNVLDNDKGLNCKLTTTNDKSGKMLDSSRLKMSRSAKNKVYSEERKSQIKKWLNNSKKVICMITGKEWESLVSCALENNINHSTLRVKLSGNFKNNTQFIYSENIPIKGVNYLCEDIMKKKKIICTITNKIWNTTRECAEENNINRRTLINKLSGHKNNNTTYEYIYNF
jgi:hypothetical protein